MKRKKQKNKLDEMKEQKLLKSESQGYWLAFWGLVITMFVQLFLYGRDFRMIAGEWIIFMLIAVYEVVACFKNGIWSRNFEPKLEVNIMISAVAGIICGIFFGAASYREYHAFLGSVATGVVYFCMIFGGCFAALSFSAFLYRKRVKRLESGEEEETGIDGKQDHSGQFGEDFHQK